MVSWIRDDRDIMDGTAAEAGAELARSGGFSDAGTGSRFRMIWQHRIAIATAAGRRAVAQARGGKMNVFVRGGNLREPPTRPVFSGLGAPSFLVYAVLVANLMLVGCTHTPAEDLMSGARSDDRSRVEAALARGADVNAKNEAGVTALMAASYSWSGGQGALGVVQALLAAGADVNATDNLGRTALMFASAQARGSVVRELLKAGANVNARGIETNICKIWRNKKVYKLGCTNCTALMFAIGNDYMDVLSAHDAFDKKNREDVVPILLQAGADVNIRKEDGRNVALQLAEDCHPFKYDSLRLKLMLQKAGARE